MPVQSLHSLDIVLSEKCCSLFSRKNVDAYNHDEQPCLVGPLKSPNKITSVVFVVEVDEKNISRLCLRVVYLESAQILVFPVDAFVFVVECYCHCRLTNHDQLP